jgi:hypothetical protein
MAVIPDCSMANRALHLHKTRPFDQDTSNPGKAPGSAAPVVHVLEMPVRPHESPLACTACSPRGIVDSASAPGHLLPDEIRPWSLTPPPRRPMTSGAAPAMGPERRSQPAWSQGYVAASSISDRSGPASPSASRPGSLNRALATISPPPTARPRRTMQNRTLAATPNGHVHGTVSSGYGESHHPSRLVSCQAARPH